MCESLQTSGAGRLGRRAFIVAAGSALAAGCTRAMDIGSMGDVGSMGLDNLSTGGIRPRISVDRGVTSSELMYASSQDGPFTVPGIPYEKVPREFRRQMVPDPTGERPGTIVVNLSERRLYLVQPGGEAVRYGVGIGREGFLWSGRATVRYKRHWPVWTPPSEMIARQPELAKWRGGQPGGLDNPLGARALYLFNESGDTGYRIHGSPEWWTIGQSMSSGCVRLINQDIIDLHDRVPDGSPVVVG